MTSVCVAVRVRPLDEREKKTSKVVIKLKANTITIYKPITRSVGDRGDERKTFSFDFSYDSTDPQSASFATQEKIYKDLGSGVLKAAFEGFNTCIFAYGQTGSGKSYTMMGHKEDKGLIPRICEGLFQELSERSKSAVSCHAEVSFLEIYNEQVLDLLLENLTSTRNVHLKVREHPKEGPYVHNLTRHLVQNYSDVEELILLGNANRMTASTDMNYTSSRSHAIFTIRFTQAWFEDELPCETVSKIHLVDLAGSERADATHATGARLKESANINKSLVTLGCVISTLVLFQNIVSTKKKKQIFIPYRDSVLTWLLKDSLGGNSKTTMIATISPADVNYGETLSTLHYASRAKNIVNSPTVNEDNRVTVIRGLQAEIARLRKLLEEANQVPKGEPSSSVEVEEKLNENEAKVEALTKEWASKWKETRNILQEKTVALRKEGSGVVLDCQLPHLIGVEEDLLGTGIILYYLKEGQTTIGSNEALCGQDIVLRGPGLLGEHCLLKNQDGAVTLIPQDGALCSVNGSVVSEPCQLTQGSIIELGKGNMFRFNHPTEAASLREKRQSGLLSSISLSLTDTSKSAENLSKVMLQKAGTLEGRCSHSQQEGEWQQVERKLSKCSEDIKGFLDKNSGDPHQQKAGESQGAETKETGTGLVNVVAVETERPVTTAIPEESAVPHSTLELDGEALQGGVSTGDGPEQERDWCHKSGPGLTSVRPQRKAESGAEDAGCGGEVWSGDASLQQMSVLGPGDGCGTRPVGNANKIQEVMADCYERRPGSGGISLDSRSHLQSTEGVNSVSVPPQTSTHSQFDKIPLSSQAVSCPTKEPTTRDQSFCREMDDPRVLEEILEVRAKPFPALGLGSLVNTMSWIVQGAGRHILSSSIVLQQVIEQRLHPVGASWSSHMVSLIRDSRVLSVVKDSRVLSLVKDRCITSLFSDIQIFSLVRDLPIVQHIQLEMTQHLYAVNPTNIHDCAKDHSKHLGKSPKQEVEDANVCTNDVNSSLPPEHENADKVKAKETITESLEAVQPCSEPEVDCAHEKRDQTLCGTSTVWFNDVNIFCQSLITFPDVMVNLQTSLLDLGASLQALIPNSLFKSQNIVALFWLKAAKSNQPKAIPALVVVMETGVYTFTEKSGALELFHYLPLLQLKELQIGYAGHTLCLMGRIGESVLGVYTFSQKLTKELCGAILSVICPGDSRVSQHPLLHGDLMKMSLKWQIVVPDLLLDAGLRVCCFFQKSLADLIYLLHSNTNEEQSCLGEVQLLLYCCIGIEFDSRSKLLGQLFVTDTHLGLLQEDIVFQPVCAVSPELCRLQFHTLTLHQLSDVRGVVVRDEDERGAVTVDVILANVKARGHPESVSASAHTSSSSSHAEVWKLTFSCSTEAACLINHLSNV